MEFLKTIALGAVVGLLMGFTIMNLMLGCESWSQPECVTPSEYLKMFIFW